MAIRILQVSGRKRCNHFQGVTEWSRLFFFLNLFPETSSELTAKKNDPQKGSRQDVWSESYQLGDAQGGERGRVSRLVIYY